MKTPPEVLKPLLLALARDGLRATATRVGVSHAALARARDGQAGTVTLERIKDKLRVAEEFKGTRAATFRAPRRPQSVLVWDLEKIRLAIDAQMTGQFTLPVALAKAMRRCDALFIAYHNRIAPQFALTARLVAANSARGTALHRKALGSIITPRTVLAGIVGTLADHGLAIGYNDHEPRADGTLVDFRLREWPLEFVRWDATRECLMTRLREGADEPIVHGDGRWTIFRKIENEPWNKEACVLPGGLLWAVLANSVKDWAAASTSHGQAKLIGELPEGWALTDENGALTPEAETFLGMLQDIVSGESGAGIRPSGAKTDFVANGSTAWQVFSELINSREKAAARIYLGTDAILGSVGGAPGVDIAALFGVATTKIQGDLDALCEGLRTGVYEPWAAINDGDSRNAPSLVYDLPDPDAKAKAEENEAKHERLMKTIERRKEVGFLVTQEVVNALASEFGVNPAPVLHPAPVTPAPAPPTGAPAA
jgi:hypothetical protein